MICQLNFPGVPVPGGGTFVVGQKQNGGAEFLEREIFRGRISQVNLWNRVLQPDEALVVAQPCVREHPGVMKSWADIKGGLVGTLYETAPSWLSSGPQTSCKRKKKQTHSLFYRSIKVLLQNSLYSGLDSGTPIRV